jgi:hypothetical protein
MKPRPLPKNLPVWIIVSRWALDILSDIGSWCSCKSTVLLDKHCGCEICKKDKRGRYRDRT